MIGLSALGTAFMIKKNKPSPKFTDNLIRQEKNYSTKQRAAQNFCLIRMLPPILGDPIDLNDPCFEIILMLKRIMGIIFVPSITVEPIVILEDLISQIFSLFNKFSRMLIP
jgi:hypothetical protein